MGHRIGADLARHPSHLHRLLGALGRHRHRVHRTAEDIAAHQVRDEVLPHLVTRIDLAVLHRAGGLRLRGNGIEC